MNSAERSENHRKKKTPLNTQDIYKKRRKETKQNGGENIGSQKRRTITVTKAE